MRMQARGVNKHQHKHSCSAHETGSHQKGET